MRYLNYTKQFIVGLMIMNLAFFFFFPVQMIMVYRQVNNMFHNTTVTSDKQLHKIFRDIVRTLPADYRRGFRLVIKETRIPNAYAAADGRVIITRGMIKAAKGDAGAIAAIFGHEIAHVVLNHHHNFKSSKYEKGIFQELMADNYGLLLAKGAGYNGCNVQNIWEVFASNYGDSLVLSSHPGHSFRAANIKRLCKRMI